MSSYVKISYRTKGGNTELKKCIMFIGKFYGKNNTDLVKSGIEFLAKKVKGASKRSVKFMIYPKSIKNSESKQWNFKKCSYDRVYRFIIYKMLQKSDHRQEGLELLHSLYIELIQNQNNISKVVSDILVLEQKDLLEFAIDKPQYASSQKVIKKILACYEECDIRCKNYLF